MTISLIPHQGTCYSPSPGGGVGGGLMSHSKSWVGLIMFTLGVPVLVLACSFKVNRKSNEINQRLAFARTRPG